MPVTTPSKRFATAQNLLDLAAQLKEKYTNKIEAITIGGRSTSISNKTVNIPVDTGLSDTSQNPVENRVVTSSINGLRARLGSIAPVMSDWSQLAAQVDAGSGESVAPVGTQIKTDWTSTTGSATYEAYWNVCHYGEAELDGGATKNVAFLQMDRCLPFDTMFSNYQAFLRAIDALPAGTYNVTMGFSWGTHVKSGKTYQFTLSNALPAGGQLAGFYGAPDNNPSSWRVYAFSSATATSATETCVVTEGDDGTSLGTFTAAGYAIVPASGTPEEVSTVTINGTDYTYYGLNSLHRVAYGNNRWLHSALRQYLNATGTNWWVPMTVFDRPPSYVGHRGFLTGLDPDFVAHMVPVKTVTALNYVTDGGTSASPLYDITYDKVFLPSGKEHYLQANTPFGGSQGLEGVVWDYWKRVAGTASPLGWSSWGSWNTYHQEYIQFDIASPTAGRTCWMRSANRGGGNDVAYVISVGSCSIYGSAIYGCRAAPAFAFGESSASS